MPPFHNKSTRAFRIALMTSFGATSRRHVEQSLSFARKLQALGAARVDAAAFGDRRARVILPGRARQAKQPFAFPERALGIGLRVDEDVLMIERRDQPDVPRLQHAVAEYVARHVADSGDGEILALDVDADFAEMALDAFPGAARGDRHFLVIVTGRTAGREGIAQPKAVFLGDRIGDVGKSRSSLVRRDHEVRVVAVMTHDSVGGDDLVVDDVIRQIQQAPNQRLVACDHLGLLRVAVAARLRA